jgi:tetratricopeptide (TPR) repeat protein
MRVLTCIAASLAMSIGSRQMVHGQATQAGSMTGAQLAHADSVFGLKQWQNAADAYRAVTQSAPQNGPAWFGLGASLEQLQHSNEASAAYERAAAVGFQPASAHFRAARIAARESRSSDALEHLRHAAAIGIPLNALDDTSFAAIRSAPAFVDIRRAAEEARYPCRAQHTFDFWVGTFDAKPWNQPDAPSGGQLHNTREYDGCVIVERWTGVGNAGMSMAFYDVNRKAWRMIWNDDGNSSNDFEGTFRDGAMRFEGWVLDPKGNRMLASNVLQEVSPDVIRHIYSTSSDSGKTWVVRSDGRFVRHKD